MIGRAGRLRVEAELGRLAEVRELVRAVATSCGASDECMDDLVQAVDEAVPNVVVHGYGGEPGWVEVAAELVGGRIVVTIEDAARRFDPTTVAPPDLDVPPERRRPGGMGIHLMRLATDELHHSPRPGGGNILTMARRLDRRPEGG